MNHASGSHLGPRESDELTPLLELQLVEAYREGDPDAMERKLCLAFLADHRRRSAGDAWTALASVLMNLDEWLVRE